MAEDQSAESDEQARWGYIFDDDADLQELEHPHLEPADEKQPSSSSSLKVDVPSHHDDHFSYASSSSAPSTPSSVYIAASSASPPLPKHEDSPQASGQAPSNPFPLPHPHVHPHPQQQQYQQPFQQQHQQPAPQQQSAYPRQPRSANTYKPTYLAAPLGAPTQFAQTPYVCITGISSGDYSENLLRTLCEGLPIAQIVPRIDVRGFLMIFTSFKSEGAAKQAHDRKGSLIGPRAAKIFPAAEPDFARALETYDKRKPEVEAALATAAKKRIQDFPTSSFLKLLGFEYQDEAIIRAFLQSAGAQSPESIIFCKNPHGKGPRVFVAMASKSDAELVLARHQTRFGRDVIFVRKVRPEKWARLVVKQEEGTLQDTSDSESEISTPLPLLSKTLSREPTPNPADRTLHVGHLPFDADATLLMSVFSKYGALESIEVKSGPRQSSAMVTFVNRPAAEAAAVAMNDQPIGTLKCRILWVIDYVRGPHAVILRASADATGTIVQPTPILMNPNAGRGRGGGQFQPRPPQMYMQPPFQQQPMMMQGGGGPGMGYPQQGMQRPFRPRGAPMQMQMGMNMGMDMGMQMMPQQQPMMMGGGGFGRGGPMRGSFQQQQQPMGMMYGQAPQQQMMMGGGGMMYPQQQQQQQYGGGGGAGRGHTVYINPAVMQGRQSSAPSDDMFAPTSYSYNPAPSSSSSSGSSSSSSSQQQQKQGPPPPPSYDALFPGGDPSRMKRPRDQQQQGYQQQPQPQQQFAPTSYGGDQRRVMPRQAYQ